MTNHGYRTGVAIIHTDTNNVRLIVTALDVGFRMTYFDLDANVMVGSADIMEWDEVAAKAACHIEEVAITNFATRAHGSRANWR